MPRSINTAVCDGINDGYVQFRLLCTNSAAAGLIGHSGMIINRLSAQTSSKIHVDKTLYSLNDRLVYVTGSSSLTRTILLAGEEFPSSAAIEAVIRVFERLLESEAESGAEVKCRMLVEDGMVGALMGKGGEKINEVSRASGAVIEVSNSRAPPLCGGVGDRLIVIEGSCLAVKKALVLICQHLQMKLLRPVGRAEDTTYSGAIYQSKKIETRNVQLNKSVNGRVEAVFKLLCPYQPSGFVIGLKGVRVRALQEETGASIYFSSAGTGCYERVVTVSAFENRKMQCSIAQNAIVRVFNEIVSFSTEEVPARLLVRPNQSDWLSAGEVPIISAIQNATDATLQVWELNYTPAGAADDEKVLEIDGDYHNVQAALLQVCWELRKSVFETSLAKKNTPLFPHELLVVPSICNEIATLRDDMIKCTVSEEVNGSQQQQWYHRDKYKAGDCYSCRCV